jgi:hypothetical protein
LQQTLQQTHFVVNHSQTNELLIANILTKKLEQRFSKKHYAGFEMLRNKIHTHHKDACHDVAFFRKTLALKSASIFSRIPKPNDGNYSSELMPP